MSNTVIHLHRSTELPAEWYADNCPVDYDLDGLARRHIVIGAMPPARAGRPSARAVLRRLGNSATIAIAVFCVVWFGLQLLRGAVS